MTKNLKDRNAFITGSNRGIGLAVVKEFASRGCNIWAGSRQNLEGGVETEHIKELKQISREYEVNIVPVYIEMADENSIKNAFTEIYKTKAPIDILVNVAGVVNTDLFQMTSMETLRYVFDINFFGQVYLTQLVLKSMVRNKSGSIINVGSIAGLDANPTNCTYGSSKAALMQFTKILASEVGRAGIRVNAVAPGPTKTDMIKLIEGAVGEENMLSRCAMSRCAETFEVAKTIAFLASNESSFINGQIIRIDGGAK